MKENNKTRGNSMKAVPAEGKMFYMRNLSILSPKTHAGRLVNTQSTLCFCTRCKLYSISCFRNTLCSKNFIPLFFLIWRGPIAVFSTEEGTNPFVSDDGNWMQDYYIPAYLRRYPIATVKGDQT